jgi:hypothetical protein
VSERTAYDAIDRYASIAALIAAAQPSDADELRASETGNVVERLHPYRLSLEVTDVIAETPTTTTLRMASIGPDLPPFLAGQYVNLFVELDGTRTSRPYAISSAPTEHDHYDLTVREVTRGFISPHLARHVRPGDVFSSTGPMGEFFHNPLFHGDRLMFLAGGSGVAPAQSAQSLRSHHRGSRGRDALPARQLQPPAPDRVRLAGRDPGELGAGEGPARRAHPVRAGTPLDGTQVRMGRRCRRRR